MKKFSFDTIRKSYKIAVEAAQPAPFSGKYPTRIAFRMNVVGRKQTVDYCGKPNLDIYRRFQKLSRTPGVLWVFFEFDRKNIISRVTNEKKDSIHKRLHTVYHPFSGGNPFYTFRQPWWRKKISGFVAYYSPTKTLKKAELDRHKAWLAAMGFIKADPVIVKKAEVKEAPSKTLSAWFRHVCSFCGARGRSIKVWDGKSVPADSPCALPACRGRQLNAGLGIGDTVTWRLL